MVACAAGLLQFNVGYGMGLTSTMIAQLTGSYLDQHTSSWFASSLTIGQALGSVLGGGLANKLGRKRVCMIAAAASILSWVLLSSSQAFWMLILGRILTGLFDSLSVPGGYMYIAEVSETRFRGSLLNSTDILGGLGIASGYLFGSILPWRYSCCVAMLINIISILILCFCHESPVFLLMKDKALFHDPALRSFSWCRQMSIQPQEIKVELQKELRSMESAASSFKKQNGIKDMVTNLFTGDSLRPFLIVLALFLLYPISGLYNIAFFAVSLFQELELGGVETVAVFTALVRVAGTLCSTLLLFRWGGVLQQQWGSLFIPLPLPCIISGLEGG